jgi:hypothetical protein
MTSTTQQHLISTFTISLRKEHLQLLNSGNSISSAAVQATLLHVPRGFMANSSSSNAFKATAPRTRGCRHSLPRG